VPYQIEAEIKGFFLCMAHASVMMPGGSFIRMKTGNIAKIVV
jgi:hypothetical protein